MTLPSIVTRPAAKTQGRRLAESDFAGVGDDRMANELLPAEWNSVRLSPSSERGVKGHREMAARSVRRESTLPAPGGRGLVSPAAASRGGTGRRPVPSGAASTAHAELGPRGSPGCCSGSPARSCCGSPTGSSWPCCSSCRPTRPGTRPRTTPPDRSRPPACPLVGIIPGDGLYRNTIGGQPLNLRTAVAGSRKAAGVITHDGLPLSLGHFKLPPESLRQRHGHLVLSSFRATSWSNVMAKPAMGDDWDKRSFLIHVQAQTYRIQFSRPMVSPRW